MNFYHTETQEDYDALMIELQAEGCRWIRSGNVPTRHNNWAVFEQDTYIKVDGKILTYGNVKNSYIEDYSNYPLIEYKAKGETHVKRRM